MPDPSELWRRLIALAALDSLLSPDWEYRYYSFDAAWAPDAHMGSMRNGSGDDFFVGFSRAGVFFKGFDHESNMSPYARDPLSLWPGMFRGCPESLFRFRDEPAFMTSEQTTFALWWDASAPGWRRGVETFPPGRDPDGSGWLLDLLAEGPVAYLEFAQGYYEDAAAQLDLSLVRRVYEHAPLELGALQAVRPAASQATLEEILAMSYGQPYPFA